MIKENLASVEAQILEACQKAGRRREDVTLIAVSKTNPVQRIKEAYDLGVRDFGENKVKEMLGKEPQLPEDIRWHLIGHLQTNKVKSVLEHTVLIHSIDSIKLSDTIDFEARKKGIIAEGLLEVNVAEEESKFGFDLNEINERVFEISEIDDISIQGPMCVAPICDDEKVLRHIFSNMYRSYLDIASKKINNVNMNVLSMGMSGDYCQAILEGANLVRVGSAIFGSRNYR